MPDLLRTGRGVWRGDLRTGEGRAFSESGVIENARITFDSRFSGAGSNPEELIAAAHAACFSMALSNILATGGHTPIEVQTTATVTLHKGESGFKITKVYLNTAGVVPGIDEAAFKAAAEKAKTNCPVSVLLIPGLEELSLDATLVPQG